MLRARSVVVVLFFASCSAKVVCAESCAGCCDAKDA
jgi:hypothetical protein